MMPSSSSMNAAFLILLTGLIAKYGRRKRPRPGFRPFRLVY